MIPQRESRKVEMKDAIVNDVVETRACVNGIYRIRVRPFMKEKMGLYEDGLRKALKGIEENDALLLDFTGNSLQGLDGRALFDLFQFISFNCLRYKNLRINWGPALLEYLDKYASRKDTEWKMSCSTISRLIGVNYDPEISGKN
jgi:hypothetical protein